jgi:hypothetical protein
MIDFGQGSTIIQLPVNQEEADMFATLMLTALIAAAPQQQAAGPLEDDQLPANTKLSAARSHLENGNGAGGGHLGHQSQNGVIGVDTVDSFTSYFYRPGVVPTSAGDFPQFSWTYTMVGRSPFGRDASEHTTRIDAPIVPVVVHLLNADGSQRFFNGIPMILDPTNILPAVQSSPLFQDFSYASSERPTQFTDAVHRASFFHMSDDDWHTLLRPSIKQARHVGFLRGTYRFAVDGAGNVVYALVNTGVFVSELFPASPDDTTTPMGAAENAGDIRTRDISTFLYNNVYLQDDFNDPNTCCILGFHSYDLEPGGEDNGFREKHYVMAYASWTTPGLFGTAFADITALSHELAELFADPFVNNATPIWVAPNGLCQNNLETGDVIEGLPNATFPITMNGFTYHPQNEALLQWFAAITPSNAVKKAYSFPDTTVLPTPSASLLSDCATPVPFAKTTKK